MSSKYQPVSIVHLIVYACTFISLSLLFFLFIKRFFFPFELHWMDGGSIEHAYRFIQGKTMYPAPSIDFVPYTYTPLYFYLVSLFTTSTSSAMQVARAISILAFSGSLCVLFSILYFETKRLPAAIAVVGLCAASYAMCGFWFDTCRADSLMLLLVVTAALVIVYKTSTISAIHAGVLCTLAFCTKQVAAIILLPIILYTLLRSPKRGLFLVLSGLTSLSFAFAILYYTQGAWFWFYIQSSPSFRWFSHFSFQSFIIYWSYEIVLTFFPILCLHFLTSEFRLAKITPGFTLILAGLLLGGCMGRVERINFVNTIIPGVFAACMWCGYSIGSIDIERLKNASFKRAMLVPLLVLCQFSVFFYDPRGALPNEEDVVRGQDLLQKLEKIPGDIWIPDHSFIPHLIGRSSFAHTIGIADALMSGDPAAIEQLKRSIEDQLARHRFAAIILDSGIFEYHLQPLLEKYYRPSETIQGLSLPAIPVQGWEIKPTIWIPKD